MSLMRSKILVQIYGKKSSNIESKSEPEPEPALLSNSEEAGEGSRKTHLLVGASEVYRATLQDNWSYAERLLAVNLSLSDVPITRAGDRALHVAVAMGYKEFVQHLVRRMSEDSLVTLLDGRGNTACCYAAISGAKEIAHLLMQKNPSVITSRDAKKVTLLHKAAFHGKREMVKYFLELTEPQHLSEQEWFDLLLVVINNKMFDVALEIVEMNGSLAHMRNNEGTALHVLVRLDLPRRQERVQARGRKPYGVEQKKRCLLAERLWAEILKLEQDDARELMSNPLILHEAAKMGNVELITMVTQSQRYPDLIWNTDEKGYTLFHIAVIHGRSNVFRLNNLTGAAKYQYETSQDDNGNNILHLAAQLSTSSPREWTKVAIPVREFQQKLLWYRAVQKNVTPLCRKMRNENGETPRQMFVKEHAKMFEKSEAWMRRTTEGCMLIATILLTMVFTALFTIPGGNNQVTGSPILMERKWFELFFIFELLAFAFSSLTIIKFFGILTTSVELNQYIFYIPAQLTQGLWFLLLSFVFTFLAFTSAYILAMGDSKNSKWFKAKITNFACVIVVMLWYVVPQFFILLGRIPPRPSDYLPSSSRKPPFQLKEEEEENFQRKRGRG